MTHAAAAESTTNKTAHKTTRLLAQHVLSKVCSIHFQVCVILETDYRPYVEEGFSALCGWSLTNVPARSPGDEWAWGHVHWERLLSCLRPLWLSCVKNAAYGSSGVKSLPGTWAKMTHWVQLCLHHGNMGADQRSSFFYSHISPPCFNRRHSASCVRACTQSKNIGAIYYHKAYFPIKTREVSLKNS